MKETKFKQTEVGMIPSDWEVKTLGELYKVHNGLSKGKQFFGHGYPFLSFSVVFNNVFIPNKLENLVDSSKEERASYSINKGDVFITRTSETVDELGMSCVALKDYPNATYNGFCKRLRPNDVEFVNLGYLGFYLRSGFIREWFLKFSTVTTRASLKNDELLSLPLVLPPTIEEQQRIANALSDVDTLIANLEKLIAKKKNIKQGAMQQLLTGRKRLPGFAPAKPTYKQTELGMIPTDWEVKNLADLGYFFSGSGFPLKYQGHVDGKYPFYKVSDFNNVGNDFSMNIANNYVSEQIARKLGCKIIPKNAILFAKIGAAIMLERKKICTRACCADNNMMAFICYDFCDAAFMNAVLAMIKFADYSASSALPSLSSRTLGTIQIAVPHSKAEQTAIANVLSDMDTEIATLETKLAKYRTLKTGMMQQLLTGKIRLIK